MKCDLHVHSMRSGRVNLPILRRLGLECYTPPREVYDLALSRGMDLVTISDHDTIDGALEIAHLPGVFISEEVTVGLPGGRAIHVGALDIAECQHQRIAERRNDAEAFFAYCAEERIPLAFNHPFSLSLGPRTEEDFDLALARVDLIETHNGGMPIATNVFARATCRSCGMGAVGGSDAHTRQAIGRAWTEVPGARTKQEYLSGLRRGWTVPSGESGNYARLTRDVISVVFAGYRYAACRARRGLGDAARFAALLLIAPLVPIVPFLTGIRHARERGYAAAMFLRWQATTGRPYGRRPLPHAPWIGADLPEISLG
ncbi:MAG: PHP domain-containing protein [Vicinamibacteria bacterium]|nr:PHP domain-containing protein [Vicinamibacteria bacterium]